MVLWQSDYLLSLTDSCRVFEKLIVAYLVKILPTFCGTQSSWLCLQEPATGSYPELDVSCAHLPTLFPWVHHVVIFQSVPRSSDQIFVCISHCMLHAYQSHSPSPYRPNNIWWSICYEAPVI